MDSTIHEKTPRKRRWSFGIISVLIMLLGLTILMPGPRQEWMDAAKERIHQRTEVFEEATEHDTLHEEKSHHGMSVTQETLLLVLLLTLLLHMSAPKLPENMAIWAYVLAGSLASGLVDSVMILMIINGLDIRSTRGQPTDVVKFKIYCTLGALIGGLIVYLGEVYALPHFIKYGMTGLFDALHLAPPILVMVGLLSFLSSRLPVKIFSPQSGKSSFRMSVVGNGGERSIQIKRPMENLIEFSVILMIIFITHDYLLALGVLLIWAFVSGQTNDLLYALRNKIELEVVLVIFIAMAIQMKGWGCFIQAYISDIWIIPAAIGNAVLTGLLIQPTGEVWLEIVYLSTGALILPISSLVGVILFKTLRDWLLYIKISIPIAALWCALGYVWVEFLMEPTYYWLGGLF